LNEGKRTTALARDAGDAQGRHQIGNGARAIDFRFEADGSGSSERGGVVDFGFDLVMLRRSDALLLAGGGRRFSIPIRVASDARFRRVSPEGH
jgi:hypothetical protein